MSKIKVGTAVIVYNQWPGKVLGMHTANEATVSYVKHNTTFCGFIPLSRLKVAKNGKKEH